MEKKFSDRFVDKNTRLMEYANQYGALAHEIIREEVEGVVRSSTERFDVCMTSFHNLENEIGSLNEKLKQHGLVSRDAEKWLRRAEENITTEPKWKVQVVLNQ